MTDKIKWHYPDDTLEAVVQDDGSVLYFATFAVAGKDDDGEFLIVLDGPAVGEKAYL